MIILTQGAKMIILTQGVLNDLIIPTEGGAR